MTVYEAVIKVRAQADNAEKGRMIAEGLSYAVLLLIDECGWSLTQVEDALDAALGAAEDEWYNLNPEGNE